MKRAMRSIILSMMLLSTLPLMGRAAQLLIPVGQIIGLQLSSNAVTVVAYDELLGGNARDSGLKIGDEIVTINGTAISCVEDVRKVLEDSCRPLNMTVRRGSRLSSLKLTPCRTNDGPRLGVYLRQGIAGIGTVTFYDPETGIFGTLGHGVSDGKGNLLQMKTGNAYEAQILSVKKGVCGEPGQLKGCTAEDTPLGCLLRNTPQGVFGRSDIPLPGQAIPTAEYSQIRTGTARIRSTVNGTTPQEYSVEILKIYPEDRSDGRNFLIKVTDSALLETTGGIVQGMSGSPILQNGKIIGAVTHVLVNDPTVGYGIYIENMLDAAG